jgi:hypothetical protein
MPAAAMYQFNRQRQRTAMESGGSLSEVGRDRRGSQNEGNEDEAGSSLDLSSVHVSCILRSHFSPIQCSKLVQNLNC